MGDCVQDLSVDLRSTIPQATMVYNWANRREHNSSLCLDMSLSVWTQHDEYDARGFGCLFFEWTWSGMQSLYTTTLLVSDSFWAALIMCSCQMNNNNNIVASAKAAEEQQPPNIIPPPPADKEYSSGGNTNEY